MTKLTFLPSLHRAMAKGGELAGGGPRTRPNAKLRSAPGELGGWRSPAPDFVVL